jgi:hypothetical protein
MSVDIQQTTRHNILQDNYRYESLKCYIKQEVSCNLLRSHVFFVSGYVKLT